MDRLFSIRVTIIVVCSVLILLNGYPQVYGQGYIHLNGKQFIDENGEPFYPMIMNYWVDFGYPLGVSTTPLDVNDCYLAQTSIYGGLGSFDYTNILDGPDRILQDFYEMQNLGFNTIRLFMPPRKKAGSGFYITIKEFPLGYDNFVHLNIDPPYNYDPVNNPEFSFYMERFLEVCSLANVAGLKVIQLCAEPAHPDYPGGGLLTSGVAGDPNISDYTELLAGMAAFVHSNNVHNLLAYEFHNEPTYADQRLLPLFHTKSEICEISEEWNEAIKLNDPGRLTTIGGVALDDPFKSGWDPNLLPVDFISMHFYLKPQVWEYFLSPGSFYSNEYKRYLDKYYIYCQALKKPFVIAETGFPGENPGSNPNLVFPISTYGDEAVQLEFLEETFPLIRNTCASGYGWWDFQNKHWYPNPNPPFLELNEYMENYLGVLRYGNPDPGLTDGYESAGLRKLAAEKFVYYKDNPPALPANADFGPVSATVDMNELFYNPYNHPVNNTVVTNQWGNSYYGTINGSVVDQFGNSIKNSIVRATSVVGADINQDPVFYSHYTYTDEFGNFELRTFDHDDLSNGHNDPAWDNIIEHLEIGSFGSSYKIYGWEPPYNIALNNDVHTLNSLQFQFDNTIDNVFVPIGNQQDFKGLSTLTAAGVVIDGNFTSGGSSEFKARYEVAMKPGFHARQGSEVHIYNEPLFVDCADIESLGFRQGEVIVSNTIDPKGYQSIREFVVNFHVLNDVGDFIVYPNPAHSDFTIEFLRQTAETNSIKEMILIDLTGREVIRRQVTSSLFQMNIPNLSPGIYFIKVNVNSDLSTKKLIVY